MGTLKFTTVGRVLIFVSVFFLGMPIGGAIPDAVRDAAAQGEIGSKVAVAAFWTTVYGAGLLVCLVRSRAAFALARANIWLVILVAWFLFSSLWALDGARALLNGAQLAGSLVLAIGISACFARQEVKPLAVVSGSILMSVLAHVLAVLALPETTVDATGRWAGMSGNPNYFGSLAASGVVMYLAVLLTRRGPRSLISVMSMLLLMFALWKSGSATALIAALVAAGWMMVARSNALGSASLMFLLFLFATVLGALIVESPAGSSWRLLDLLGKDTSLTGRDVIWSGALESIGRSPILGTGIGTDTAAIGVLHRSTTIHNGYLQTLVDGGIVAGILAVAWLLTVVVASHGRAVPRDEGYIALSGIVVLMLVHNAAESSFFVARSPVWIIAIITVLLVSSRRVLSGAGTNRGLRVVASRDGQ